MLRYVTLHFNFLSNSRKNNSGYAVADLRGGGMRTSFPRSKFFQFHVVFGKIDKIVCCRCPLSGGLVPPPRGNPGSATTVLTYCFANFFVEKCIKMKEFGPGGGVSLAHTPHTLDPQILLSQFIYWTPREGAALAPLPSHPHTLDPQMPLFFYKRLYIVNLDPEGAARPYPPRHTHTHFLDPFLCIVYLDPPPMNVGGLIRGREGGEREG